MAAVTSGADILIVAAGRAKMIGGEYVKDEAVVVDVGINVDETGALVGDVDYAAVIEKALAATPVPGGVGTVTTALLVRHTVEAAERTLLG
jgi:methylenetetrahydrofolate dehydrogenase (NADP+)/methenyltetrahydrofolate cyclohydrolase